MKITNERLLSEKRDYYIAKLSETEDKLARVAQRQEEEGKKRMIEDLLRRLEKQENLQKHMRMEEYQKEQITEKINSQAIRTEMLKKEREALLQTRFEIKKKIDEDKAKVLEKFEKVKIGKLDPQALAEEYGFSPEQKEENKDKSKKGGGSVFSDQNNRKNVPVKKNRSLNEGGKDDENFENGLQELKLKLNNQILVVLEEEQEKELKRDQMLNTEMEVGKKKELEKQFAIERGIAQKRIEKLSELILIIKIF